MTKSYRQKYNEKYGFAKDASHSIADIAKTTGYQKAGLQKIFDKGVGARKTNPESVRSVSDGKKRGGKSLRGKMSAEQWGQARIYSAVMGGAAQKYDKDLLKKSKK